MTTPRFTLPDSTFHHAFRVRGTTIARIAADALAAGRSFLERSDSWYELDLARWERMRYARVAQDVGSVASQTERRDRGMAITTAIDNARAEVMFRLDRLNDAATSSEIVIDMIDAGFVAPAVDANGTRGWVPTTLATRLADRVLSLFVAAHLTREISAATGEAWSLAA